MKKSYVATSLTLSIAVGVSGFASVPALAKSKDIDYSKEWETPQYIGPTSKITKITSRFKEMSPIIFKL